MALLSSPPSPFVALGFRSHLKDPNPNSTLQLRCQRSRFRSIVVAASNLCEQEALTLDARSLTVKEYFTEAELLAAVRLRIRTFYEFKQATYNIEDHKRHLTEREYEALKDRIGGMSISFKRVTCINATLPLSPSLVSAHELCSSCKFSEDGENRVVVGTLDLNQCLSLVDELTGKKPQGTGADLKRAYLTNVCVAKELQRNGLGYALIAKSKEVAHEWDRSLVGLKVVEERGEEKRDESKAQAMSAARYQFDGELISLFNVSLIIDRSKKGMTDLYVHVAVDNQAARKLYEKSGFVYEDEEPAWRARFLGRPRRYLLWTHLTKNHL